MTRLQPRRAEIGDRVVVLHGRWAGREGLLVALHTTLGGVRQQPQTYPVVDLDASGRAVARRVRVLAVAPTSK